MAQKKAIKIKIGLLKAGVSQSDIARQIGRDRSYVSHVIRGSFKSKEVAQIVKSLTGVEL